MPALLDGPIADALAAYVTTNAIDLVVITTHGWGGLTRLWLGSIATKLAHQSTAPLLLIRPDETLPELTAPRTFHHFLVPLDGSQLAEQALAPTIELARLLRSECTLAHVVEPVRLPGYSPIGYTASVDLHANESLRRDAERYLATVAQRIQAGDVPLHINVVSNRQPAAGIIHASGESDIDVIAMTSHGRGGLARALIGSVTDKVVRGSEAPVLLYQPKASSV